MNHPQSVLTNVLHPSVELTANSGHYFTTLFLHTAINIKSHAVMQTF